MKEQAPESDQQQAQNQPQPSQQKTNTTNTQSSYVPYQSPQGKKPTIQAKQRPVKAKHTPVQRRAKEGQTLKLGDKEIDLAKIPFDRYYDEKGNFLFEDTKKTDYVKVISTKNLEQYIAKREPGFMMKFIEAVKNENTTLLLKVFTEVAVGMQEAHLSASAYSSIYTDILEKAGYDMYKLYGMKVAVKTPNDSYGNPGKSDTEIFTSLSKGERFKITVNHKDGHEFLKKYLTTTSNILNALGAHEYRGHGEKRFGADADPNDRLKLSNHHLAYEEQIFHDPVSWAKTTKEFKLKFLDQYEAYLLAEDPVKYKKKKPEIDKLRRQYNAKK